MTKVVCPFGSKQVSYCNVISVVSRDTIPLMIKGSSFLFMLVVAVMPCVAQPVVSPELRVRQAISAIHQTGLAAGAIHYGVSVPKGEVKGDYYWSSTWNQSRVLLADGKLVEGVLMKLDAKRGELHILLEREIKVLPTKFVGSFAWIDSLDRGEHFFVRSAALGLTVPIPGSFVEVLDDGGYKLLKRIRIEEKAPDYNLALHVGSRDTRLFKREEFYLVSGSAVSSVSRVRDVARAVPDRREGIQAYARAQRLVKGEGDLRKLVAYLNGNP